MLQLPKDIPASFQICKLNFKYISAAQIISYLLYIYL